MPQRYEINYELRIIDSLNFHLFSYCFLLANGYEFVIYVYYTRYKRFTISPSFGNEGEQGIPSRYLAAKGSRNDDTGSNPNKKRVNTFWVYTLTGIWWNYKSLFLPAFHVVKHLARKQNFIFLIRLPGNNTVFKLSADKENAHTIFFVPFRQ